MESWKMVSIGSANGPSLIRRHVVIITDVDLSYYDDVIMSAMASKITNGCLLKRLFRPAQIKENIKAPRHWPLWGELTDDRASNAENFSIWWRHHHQLDPNVNVAVKFESKYSNFLSRNFTLFRPRCMYVWILYCEFENCTFQITALSLRVQISCGNDAIHFYRNRYWMKDEGAPKNSGICFQYEVWLSVPSPSPPINGFNNLARRSPTHNQVILQADDIYTMKVYPRSMKLHYITHANKEEAAYRDQSRAHVLLLFSINSICFQSNN